MKKLIAAIPAVLLAAALLFTIAAGRATETPDNDAPDTQPTFVRMEDAAAADGSSFTEKKEQAGTIIAYDGKMKILFVKIGNGADNQSNIGGRINVAKIHDIAYIPVSTNRLVILDKSGVVLPITCQNESLAFNLP